MVLEETGSTCGSLKEGKSCKIVNTRAYLSLLRCAMTLKVLEKS